MGLDTSHDCWHGAYSAFHRWRSKLAEITGVPYAFMEGIYDQVYDGAISGPLAKYLKQFLPIEWDSLKPDPLHVLLMHSDCEGEIAVADLLPIAARLEELLPMLPDKEDGGHIGAWREKTQKFIDGLRLAASRNEPVEFH